MNVEEKERSWHEDICDGCEFQGTPQCNPLQDGDCPKFRKEVEED